MKKKIAWLLILVLALGLAGCGGSSGDEGPESAAAPNYYPTAFVGAINEDGNAFVPTMDGGVFEVNGEVRDIYITPDRSKAVYLDDDGGLFYIEIPDGERERIARDAASCRVSDKCVWYFTEDEEEDEVCLYRYAYGDEEAFRVFSAERDAAGNMGFDARGLNAVYTVDEKVYYLGWNDAEPEKIGAYEGVIYNFFVAQNGSFAVWADISGSTVTLYCWENGERSRLGEFESTSQYPYCLFFADPSEQYFTAACDGSEIMFFKKIGEDAVKIKLPDKLSIANMFPKTPQGYFGYVPYDPAGGFYILSGDTLCWIDSEGEREKAASNVADFTTAGGWIYLLDADGNLRAGPAEGSELELEKIAGDVGAIVNSAIGADVIYYLRSVSDSHGTLYALEVGGVEPVKVAGGVYSSYLTYGTDGKTIYFFKDCDSVPGTSNTMAGSLYRYTFGDESPEKISGDVVVEYVRSGVNPYVAEADSFLYRKAPEYRDGSLYFNWMYYDGAESVRLAGDVSISDISALLYY